MLLHRLKMLPLRKLAVPILCSYLLLNVCNCLKPSEKHRTQEEGESETSLARNSKNLFPFVWVTFQASPCGTNKDGVCVQRGKCTKKGGSTNGNCQDGFGECCTFTEKCDVNRTQVDVNQLVTILESPTPNDVQCSFKFKKEPNICQIRLDFEQYMSASADFDGKCLTDRLLITNSITVDKEFTACGDLTGQHMYLTYGTQDSIEVTPILKMASSRYRIVATRIPCDSKNRAPDYCLQYFTKPNGRVTSFDYNKQQQDNQKYTICVKPMVASSMVQWTPCTVTTGKAFDIVTPNPQVPVGAPACNTDWIQVKGKDKMCETFSKPDGMSTWKPYELLVNFDDKEVPPPPPMFSVVADPCDATSCDGMSQPGIYTCACLTDGTCQCIIEANSGLIDGTPDFNNTGFCLEYSQL